MQPLISSILISHSYFLRFDPKQWELGLPYPPLATLYAASVLRQQGHPVVVYDNMFSKDPTAIEVEIQKLKPSVFVLYDDGFNYLRSEERRVGKECRFML